MNCFSRQQDALEFFNYLFNGLQEEMKERAPASTSPLSNSSSALLQRNGLDLFGTLPTNHTKRRHRLRIGGLKAGSVDAIGQLNSSLEEPTTPLAAACEEIDNCQPAASSKPLPSMSRKWALRSVLSRHGKQQTAKRAASSSRMDEIFREAEEEEDEKHQQENALEQAPASDVQMPAV